MDSLSAVFRWIHILAGIIWLGMLYFFNFVNGPFQGTMDGDTKKKVNPELMPRALWWFRWGAAWTWAISLRSMCGSATVRTERALCKLWRSVAASVCQQVWHSSAIRVPTKRQRRGLQGQML